MKTDIISRTNGVIALIKMMKENLTVNSLNLSGTETQAIKCFDLAT